MDGKEFINDNGFKRQSSVGLSIVEVSLSYMFISYKFFWSQFFFSLLLTKFRKSHKHQALRDASCNLFYQILLTSLFLLCHLQIQFSRFSRKLFFLFHEAPKDNCLLLYLCLPTND